MRFQRLDLNLLVALDALLAERSVSLAAERICLSQSATSSALARLRDYFGDELLIVKGRKMIPTARAESLIEPVRAVLEQIRTTIAVIPTFDPAESDRTIRIMASDYSTEVLLSGVLREFGVIAPRMRFEIHAMQDTVIESLERGVIDLAVTLDFALSPDHPSQILFEDDYVVVGWAENPAMAEPMTMELFLKLGHITMRFGKERAPAFEDWFVRRQKQQRNIELVAPSFLSVPGLLIGSSRISSMHRRLATRMVEYLPLVIRELPLDTPPIREAVQWHITNNNDPAIRWVVEHLIVAAATEPTRRATSKVVPLHEERASQHSGVKSKSGNRGRTPKG